MLPRVILCNVRNRQKWEIIPRDVQEGLRHMIESVLRLKYTTTEKEFTEICARIRLEVLRSPAQAVGGELLS